ncbi:hypothetical protein [Streptomyces sp. NPDC001985]|uniref:hypothetical protein n=1 Tax=Streptomyces sp. NPDC001985 TaxID=3154406 RepID=UPI00331820CE
MVVQQHRSRGAAVAVVAAVLGAVAAGGCSAGGRDGGADGDRPGPGSVQGQGRAGRVADGAAEEVRAAADRLVAAGSARVRTSMETAAGGTRVTIRGEGGYDFARREGRLTVVLPKDPAGTDDRSPVTELMTSGALYMKNRGAGVPADKWVRVETASLADGNLVTGGATDPLAAAELLRSARDVSPVGRTTVGGVAVRHFRGGADIARAARVAAPHVRASLAAAAKGFARDAVPFDVYLDDEGRVRKLRHRFHFGNGRGSVAVVSETLLYDFGAPVAVRLPARGDIYAGRIRG